MYENSVIKSLLSKFRINTIKLSFLVYLMRNYKSDSFNSWESINGIIVVLSICLGFCVKCEIANVHLNLFKWKLMFILHYNPIISNLC